MRMALIAVLLLAACPTSSPPRSTLDAPPASPATQPASAPAAAAALPEGSGDYRAALALVEEHRAGRLSFAELGERLAGRQLRPHPLGCAYLMTPVPAPPPGVAFDARLMPKDWEGTWGEVTMAFWLGRLSREEHAALHRLAHPSCPPLP